MSWFGYRLEPVGDIRVHGRVGRVTDIGFLLDLGGGVPVRVRGRVETGLGFGGDFGLSGCAQIGGFAGPPVIRVPADMPGASTIGSGPGSGTGSVAVRCSRDRSASLSNGGKLLTAT